ncbi:hypothetical protein V8F33_007487 [Rhypophila sp. PSN 637]
MSRLDYGEAWKGKGKLEDILGPGRPYSIALLLRAWSNKGLIVTLLLYNTVQVILEELIGAFLVSPREARLVLYRHSEQELTSALEVQRMMRKRGREFWDWGKRQDGCLEGMSELAPVLGTWLVRTLDDSPEGILAPKNAPPSRICGRCSGGIYGCEQSRMGDNFRPPLLLPFVGRYGDGGGPGTRTGSCSVKHRATDVPSLLSHHLLPYIPKILHILVILPQRSHFIK